ncbi:YuiA family protein [Marininema mesophilum]|nr:YuiA family protein [Marininema mesophilum]
MEGSRLVRKGERCIYCEGRGYYQLLLGGSETCGCCKGSGKQPKK